MAVQRIAASHRSHPCEEQSQTKHGRSKAESRHGRRDRRNRQTYGGGEPMVGAYDARVGVTITPRGVTACSLL